MSRFTSFEEREALVRDVLAFLHRNRVRARDFGRIVNGDGELVPRLRAGLRVTPDFEIRVRVVMVDWGAFGTIDPLDRNERWRRAHGFDSRAAGIRELSRQGLTNNEIAKRLHMLSRDVSAVLSRPELAPKRRAA